MKTTRRGFFGLLGAAIAAKPAAATLDWQRAIRHLEEAPPALTIESLTHAFTLMQAQALQPTTLLVPPELYQTARAILDEGSAPARPGDLAFASSPYVNQPYRVHVAKLNQPDWFKVTRAG